MGNWNKTRLVAVSETNVGTVVADVHASDPADLRPLNYRKPLVTRPDRTRGDLPCTKVNHSHLVSECGR